MSISDEVEAIRIHDLVPGGNEVLNKLRARIRFAVDFGQSAKLRVGAEDEVGAGGRPLDLARLAVATVEDVRGFGLRELGRVHVEQVHEEVRRQRADAIGEDAVLGAAEIGAENAHAADENRHFRRRQREQLSLVDQQLFG